MEQFVCTLKPGILWVSVKGVYPFSFPFHPFNKRYSRAGQSIFPRSLYYHLLIILHAISRSSWWQNLLLRFSRFPIHLKKQDIYSIYSYLSPNFSSRTSLTFFKIPGNRTTHSNILQFDESWFLGAHKSPTLLIPLSLYTNKTMQQMEPR